METLDEVIARWREAVREMTALQPAAYAVMSKAALRALDPELALTHDQIATELHEYLYHPASIALRAARSEVKALIEEYFDTRHRLRLAE